MPKIAVASTSVFILSTNNFHDGFLIKLERRITQNIKYHKIMNWSVLVKILSKGKNAGYDGRLKALGY
jgi:hypothetical protein